MLITTDGKVYSLTYVNGEFNLAQMKDFEGYEVNNIMDYTPDLDCDATATEGEDVCNPKFTIILNDGSTVTK